MKSKVVSVKPGYKMTPLGEIPEDWKVKRLGDIAVITMGQSPEGITYNNLGIGLPLLNGPTEFGAVHPVAVQWTSWPTKLSTVGDLLLCVRGSSVGRVNISDTQYCIGRGVAAIKARETSDQNFLRLLISNVITKILILTSGSTFPNIDGRSLKSFEVSLPPVYEQKAIAKVLSTWDKAIEITRQLIEKKELRKKTLMQQLLTGKKRLKGFSGEWKEVRLGDLGTTFTGLSGKTKSDFGVGKPYVPYLNVFNNFVIDIEHLDYVKVSPLEDQNRLKYGDIIFTTSSETPSEVGMASVVLDHVGELYLNSFCFGFRLHDFEILVPQYSSWYFRSSKFRMMINKFAQGATRYNLSKTQMMHLKVTLPSIKEQIAIANLLGITDADLKIEKERLEKLKLQKKALMQVLLTGKRRISCE